MAALLRSRIPVFELAGQPAPDLARSVMGLAVRSDTQGLTRLEARFGAWGAQPQGSSEGWLHLDGASLDFGRQLLVRINDRVVFAGAISAIGTDWQETGVAEVVVHAEDALMKLRLTHRCKTYEDADETDILGFIAGQHGLTPSVDLDRNPHHKVVQQWNQSDLAFLRERARLLNAELWLDGTTLHMASRERRAGNEITLIKGDADTGRSGFKLTQLRARADLAHQRSAVVVSGYDVGDAQAIEEEAGPEALGLNGPQLLGQTLGEFKSRRQREVPLGSAAAQAWARAEMQRRSGGFVRVDGITDGTAEMLVGCRLRLEGVGPLFSGGRYHVTAVAQTFDTEHGHRTAFSAERPNLEAQMS